MISKMPLNFLFRSTLDDIGEFPAFRIPEAGIIDLYRGTLRKTLERTRPRRALLAIRLAGFGAIGSNPGDATRDPSGRSAPIAATENG
jgi:hypothetical protein